VLVLLPLPLARVRLRSRAGARHPGRRRAPGIAGEAARSPGKGREKRSARGGSRGLWLRNFPRGVFFSLIIICLFRVSSEFLFGFCSSSETNCCSRVVSD
jgi:hypothetical protein